ncbi:MAG: EAL domain-containing protein [Gammaproteobacteria bacterium]|nr:EAL domain-containing protein [Gammaproteobacteria bacterium]
MRTILLVEPSSTLRHALKRSLLNQGYALEIKTSFAQATQALDEYTPGDYSGIIIGWPLQTHPSADEFLARLYESPHLELPLLVLAHDVDSTKLGWVSGRPQTAFLLWDNYEETVKTLPNLFSRQDHSPCCTKEDASQIRVLLVDDSPTARVKFRKLLDHCGYQSMVAASATEAMEMAMNDKYDIAIIDYYMPDENGDALCRRLRTNPYTANIMVGVLTSTYLDKVIQSSLAAGAVECMFKNEADDLFRARVAAMSRTVLATKRIEQERTRLEGILSSVGDGVYGVNTAGLITFINPAARQLLGYDAQINLIRQHPNNLFHKYVSENSLAKTADLVHIDKSIREGRELHGIESIFTRVDGTPIQVELTIYPMRIDGQHEGAVIAFRDVSMRKLLEEELKWQASHDALTKLLNRKFIEDMLEEEVRRIKRSEEQSALLYLDIDRFKYINDTMGHTTGDQLLIEIGAQLQTRLRKSDLLGRLGGDEFGILLRNITGDNVFQVADKFRLMLDDYTFARDGRTYKINASIGVAVISAETHSAGEVLANADIACHIAKGKGRNMTHVYQQDQDNKAAMDLELGWSARLHHALQKDTFQLYYQPIVALQELDTEHLPDESGKLWEYLLENDMLDYQHYEVLIRLHNSHGQPITPGAFLPTAERFNMMRDIDRWVINAALKQMSELGPDYKHVTFAINLSGQSMAPGQFSECIRECIEKYQLNPARLMFEITESFAIHDSESACKIIDELTQIGCRFALDDFGSGYSSFSQLKRLPVEYIKIDGMFVRDMANDPMDMAIIRSITHIAHTLGKKTVAEFVESPAALRLLKECGVDYVQGYYISRPLTKLPEKLTTVIMPVPRQLNQNGS